MSGAMRKIGEYLGLLEDTGMYDEEYDEQPYDERDKPYDTRGQVEQEPTPARRAAVAVTGQPAPVADLSQRRRASAPAPAAGVAELSMITTLHPRTYNEARTIGENFREGIPVIMNLSEMDDADAKRLVDFAAGLVFATRGTIERVTAKVFLLSPPNVTVAAEDKARMVEGGFFNQS
jgi:cell division inhibitor SepF